MNVRMPGLRSGTNKFSDSLLLHRYQILQLLLRHQLLLLLRLRHQLLYLDGKRANTGIPRLARLMRSSAKGISC